MHLILKEIHVRAEHLGGEREKLPLEKVCSCETLCYQRTSKMQRSEFSQTSATFNPNVQNFFQEKVVANLPWIVPHIFRVLKFSRKAKKIAPFFAKMRKIAKKGSFSIPIPTNLYRNDAIFEWRCFRGTQLVHPT